MAKKSKSNNNFLLYAVAALVILGVAYYFMTRKPPTTEGYNATSFSSNSGLSRTPVTFAFRGSGFNMNPEYWASDPTDKHVPLEIGGQSFSQRPVSVIVNKPILKSNVDFVEDEHLGAPGHPPGMLGEYSYGPTTLVNDTKLRLDMITSGEADVHRVLNNMYDDRYKMIPGDYQFEAEACLKDPGEPLYAPWYFQSEILGH